MIAHALAMAAAPHADAGAPAAEPLAEAVGRGLALLVLLALLGVLLVTAVALLLARHPADRRPGRRRGGWSHPENDPWAAAASRVDPSEGDAHFADHSPPPGGLGGDGADPNDETMGPYDEPWR